MADILTIHWRSWSLPPVNCGGTHEWYGNCHNSHLFRYSKSLCRTERDRHLEKGWSELLVVLHCRFRENGALQPNVHQLETPQYQTLMEMEQDGRCAYRGNGVDPDTWGSPLNGQALCQVIHRCSGCACVAVGETTAVFGIIHSFRTHYLELLGLDD